MVKILSLFLWEVILVPFFTTMEVVAPLEKDPILSGRSIWSFRHLELLNPYTGYDFINIFAFLCEKFF